MKYDPAAPRPLEEQNKIIAAVLGQQFIQLVEVNQIIGMAARDLLQKHPALKKPYDASWMA